MVDGVVRGGLHSSSCAIAFLRLHVAGELGGVDSLAEAKEG